MTVSTDLLKEETRTLLSADKQNLEGERSLKFKKMVRVISHSKNPTRTKNPTSSTYVAMAIVIFVEH